MHALARLIQQRRREDPTLTFARIAELSGGAISPSLAQHLGSKGNVANLPEPRTIIGLAKALDVPQSKVLLAAAEAVGIDVDDITDKASLDSFQADLATIPTEMRQSIEGLIRVTVNYMKG